MPTFDSNVLRNLRLGNIFQPETPEFQASPMAVPDDNSMSFAPQRNTSFDLESYQPETAMRDKMTGMVNNMPSRESPSLLRKIGGILAMASGGGFGAYENITQKPYHDKMREFNDKFEPITKATGLENTQNTNMRMLANQVATDRRGQESIDLRDRTATAKIENDAKKTAISEARSKAYIYKQMNPEHKMVVDEHGKVFFVDPTNPANKVDTGLNTGDLDDTDKAILSHNNKMAEIGATGNQARLTEGTRQEGRETLKDQGAWDIATVTGDDGKTRSVRINKNTGEIKELNTKGVVTKQGTDKTGSAASSSSAAAKGETPQQYKVRVFNDAQKVARENPTWAKFIKAKPDGTVIITKPGSGGLFSSGPDEKTYKEITSKIGIDPKTGSTEEKVTANSSSNDRVEIFKDGKSIGTIPRTQIEQAKAQGYTVK